MSVSVLISMHILDQIVLLGKVRPSGWSNHLQKQLYWTVLFASNSTSGWSRSFAKKLLYRSVVFAQYWPLKIIWITCKNNVFLWTLFNAKGGSPDDMDHLKKNNSYMSAISRPIRMIQIICKIMSLFAIKMFCNRPFHPNDLDPVQDIK